MHLLFLFFLLTCTLSSPPNIVYIMFDDLGWSDVSYNGGKIPTPNIDSLFHSGVSLDRHYIHLICSVSRSQFLTGRYSMYSGYGKMSAWGVGTLAGIPNGLPTLPQYLQELSDYTTYGVGKWHLGYATPSLLPHSKGFDHFFGFWQGSLTYATGQVVNNKCDDCLDKEARLDVHMDGQDFDFDTLDSLTNTMHLWRDQALQYINTAATTTNPFYLYFALQSPHGPLNVVDEYIDDCKAIFGGKVDSQRNKYCQIMMLSDDIVGDLITSLKDNELYDNTLIVMTSDNGADIENTGCNYPYRGTKGTLFDGNQLVPTLVSGGIVPETQYGTRRYSLLSSLDWTPTLLSFAGVLDQINTEDYTWDGMDITEVILKGDDYNQRDHLLVNIGLTNLDSATVVFRYPEDGVLYKYSAQDRSIERAKFMRIDGWCVLDDDGIAQLISDYPNKQDEPKNVDDVNGKFLFDLDHDVPEINNLLIEKEGTMFVRELVKYAKGLIMPYMEHELYSENVHALWNYQESEALVIEDYLHPWLSQEEYEEAIDVILKKEMNGGKIKQELYDLYMNQWEVKKEESIMHKHANILDKIDIDALDEDTIKVPSSCIGLKDGAYLLKPLSDPQYPLVFTKCRSEYMMIDINLDPDWKQYFTSFSQWHYSIGGPDKNDRVNWNDWFIPADKSADYIWANTKNNNYLPKETYTEGTYPSKYIISPKCELCNENDAYLQQYKDKTVYNMNPAAYGLFFGVRRPACDFDWDTLECKTCKWNQEGYMTGYARNMDLTLEDTAQNDRNLPNIMIGVCLTEPRSAFQAPTQDWQEFTGYGAFNYKPTIGMDGRFCQCYRASEDENEYFEISKDIYSAKQKSLEMDDDQENIRDDIEKTPDNNVVYLYQSDFEVGTYRITEPGTYIIMEDIEFNFNKPDYEAFSDLDSPNDPDQDWWWPPSDMKDEYPGAGYQAREQYMAGYFAGITIETHDVILDLNHHTIQQSKEYFYQQSFFALIELMSQPFLPNQGPGFFGADPQFAENVVIKNGVLGRSAHHGIHGTKNKNIKIENVHIHSFMTHGIQINGFEGLHLENIEVGPTTKEAFLNHNYAHLRTLLPYLNKMANFDDDHRTQTIAFDPELRDDDNKAYTMNDLLDIAVPKLDKVLKYVMSDDFDAEHLKELAESDEDFQLFTNPSGKPYGAVVYGVYLNYPGSGIFGWDVSDQRSSDLYMKDVKVHDLEHEGVEVYGISKNKKRFVVNTLLAPLNIEHLFGSMDIVRAWVYDSYHHELGGRTDPHYVGNIATDIYIAMYKFGGDRFDEWWLGTPYFGLEGRIVNWAEGTDGNCMGSLSHGGEYWEPVCAMDGMVHPGKGLIGIKMTNIDNAVFDSGSIQVYNLFDTTALGAEDVCISASNQLENLQKVIGSEQTPYQVAYSMNQIFGISFENSHMTARPNVNVKVSNLKSSTGRVLGMATWYGSKVKFAVTSSVEINDLFAGYELDNSVLGLEYNSLPNHLPEACAFGKWDGRNVEAEVEYVNGLDNYYDTLVKQYCVYGHIGCWGDEEVWTNIDEYKEKMQCEMKENKVLSSNYKVKSNDNDSESNKANNNKKSSNNNANNNANSKANNNNKKNGDKRHKMQSMYAVMKETYAQNVGMNSMLLIGILSVVVIIGLFGWYKYGKNKRFEYESIPDAEI